jgi:hypothetical protein
MPVYNTFNYCKVILRPFHATPKTVVLRTMPSIYNSMQRFPDVDDVRTGTIYGAGQFEQQEYLTGTLSPGGGGGTRVYGIIG